MTSKRSDRSGARPSRKPPCVHHIRGRIGFRPCTHDYRCGRCEFDQFFQDAFSVHAVIQPVDLYTVDGVKIPQGVYLHRGHMWAKVEEDRSVRIGLDDFAHRLFGPLDGICPPLIGKTLRQGQADIGIHRGAERARLLSPVSGIVTAVNTPLGDRASAAGENPYAEGWILCVHADGLRGELRNLMIGEQARGFLKDEIDRLCAMIEQSTGPLAADGGYIGEDIYGKLPQLGWERLVRRFLQNPP